MPTGDDLCGLGMNPNLSAVLGNQPSSLTCSGTAQGTAALIKTHNVELVAASSQTGAILPSAAKIGTPYFLFASASTSAVAYVPSGHTLAGTLNGGVTIAQNKAVIMWQYKKNNWAYVLLA